MKFLAIDTTAKGMALAAQKDDAYLVYEPEYTMQHSVRLMDAIDTILERICLTVKECDFIACAVGPGSFTGIRIGISTVKGLCFAADVPALAVTSLQVIAYAEENGNKIAIVDAGHGNVYAEGFGSALLEAGFYPVSTVLELAERTGALLLSAEEVAGVETKRVCVSEGLLKAARALCGNARPASELAAVYLRKSSAEEGR